MNIIIEHRASDSYDLGVPRPTSVILLPNNVRVERYRIVSRSLDTFLSRVYSHTRDSLVRSEHVSSNMLYWYADVHFRYRSRYRTLTLAVCAAPGYLTRRLHYLYAERAIERAESGIWVAYDRDSNVTVCDSLADLLCELA